jgi:hypothetical protein
MDLKSIWDVVGWIYLTQDRDHWRNVVSRQVGKSLTGRVT